MVLGVVPAAMVIIMISARSVMDQAGHIPIMKKIEEFHRSNHKKTP
jgi:hypothetical protein